MEFIPYAGLTIIHHEALNGSHKILKHGRNIYCGHEVFVEINEAMARGKIEIFLRKIFKFWIGIKPETIEISAI